MHIRDLQTAHEHLKEERGELIVSTSELTISAQAESEKIEAFIESCARRMPHDGLLIGLSGGLDSAVVATLSVRAVGAQRVHLLNLPERDSSPVHQRDAQALADALGIPLQRQDISNLLQQMGTYRQLPIGSLPLRGVRAWVVRFGRRLLGLDRSENVLKARFEPESNSLLSRGTAYAMSKHRMRMLVLYQHAEINNWLVVGAANRTEWLTGTFSKWGCDQCADLMPILHLFRTQVEQLAEFLEIPAFIRQKKADPDILPGVNDKEALLGSFEATDQILMGIENGLTPTDLKQLHDPDDVQRILELHRLSTPMRVVPYHLGLQ